jgi:AcrR family transcriptional regulator
MKVHDAKERIVNVASRLFYQQGYNSTGINQIIAEAEVAKASLYQYFPSKDDLCVEYLKRKHDRWFAELEAYLNRLASPKEKLVGAFDFLDKHSKKENYRGCSFLNIISEIPDEDSKVIAEAKKNKQQLRKTFKAIAKQGGYTDSDTLGDQLYLLLEGAITESQVQKSAWPIKLARDMAVALLK